MKLLKNGAFLFCLTLCCLFMGYYLGYCDANDITVSESLQEGRIEKKEEITYNKTIAIINMDEGVTKDKTTINYAGRLIDTVTDDIVVTGLEDARRGIESGNYSAYMMIPANFSENVQTVSKKPVRSQISYAVGTGLKGNERDETIYRIQNILQLFQDDLSKVYLSSILEEYHDAQDSAATIMNNDSTDMELLLSIEGEDLVELIELPEITEIENEIETPELSENYKRNEETVERIDEAYHEFYEEGRTKLTEIQESFSETEDQISQIQVKLSALNDAANTADQNKWDDTEKIEEENNRYEELKTELLTRISGTSPTSEEGDPPELPEEDLTAMTAEELLELLINEAKGSRLLRNDVIKEKETKIEGLSEAIRSLLTEYAEMKASYEEKQTELSGFDMTAYMDEARISAYLSEMQDSIFDIEETVEELILDYEEYAENVYETTREDMEAFEETIIEAQELSEKKLETELAAAKDSRASSNEMNLYLLDTFQERLPYTRLGEVENKEGYEFIAAPVTGENRSDALPETVEAKSPGIAVMVTIAVLLSLLLVLAVYYLHRQRKNRVTTVLAQEVIENN